MRWLLLCLCLLVTYTQASAVRGRLLLVNSFAPNYGNYGNYGQNMGQVVPDDILKLQQQMPQYYSALAEGATPAELGAQFGTELIQYANMQQLGYQNSYSGYPNNYNGYQNYGYGNNPGYNNNYEQGIHHPGYNSNYAKNVRPSKYPKPPTLFQHYIPAVNSLTMAGLTNGDLLTKAFGETFVNYYENTYLPQHPEIESYAQTVSSSPKRGAMINPSVNPSKVQLEAISHLVKLGAINPLLEKELIISQMTGEDLTDVAEIAAEMETAKQLTSSFSSSPAIRQSRQQYFNPHLEKNNSPYQSLPAMGTGRSYDSMSFLPPMGSATGATHAFNQFPYSNDLNRGMDVNYMNFGESMFPMGMQNVGQGNNAKPYNQFALQDDFLKAQLAQYGITPDIFPSKYAALSFIQSMQQKPNSVVKNLVPSWASAATAQVPQTPATSIVRDISNENGVTFEIHG